MAEFPQSMTSVPLPQPKNADTWLALPELPMGDHELFNVGCLQLPIALARKSGVPDLPQAEDGDHVILANVEVIENTKPVMYRLPMMFGSIARRMYADAGRARAAGHRFLPSQWRFEWLTNGDASVSPVRN